MRGSLFPILKLQIEGKERGLLGESAVQKKGPEIAVASRLDGPIVFVAMARRPNTLWICTDQQRFDTIAALGHPGVKTPNIDRLVANGTAFALLRLPIAWILG